MKKLMTHIIVLIGAFACLMFLHACSSTEITGTWSKPNVNPKYDHVMVAALTGSVTTRSTVEKELAQELRDEGVNVSESVDIIPQRFIDDSNKKQDILDNIRTNGVDAILTISLIDKETETRYVPGSYTYAPYPTWGYYGTFWGYYDYWFPRFQSQGYYMEDKVYFIETNLYDANTEELIWSAQSQTYDPRDLQSFAEEFADDISDEMMEDELI